MEPGFYWARRKGTGELTVVQIDADLDVTFICNLSILDVAQARQDIEILVRIPEPTP